LTQNPKKRLTAEQALNHKWFYRLDGKGNKISRKRNFGKGSDKSLVLSDSDEEKLEKSTKPSQGIYSPSFSS